MTEPNDGKVVYTVKELLHDIRLSVASVDTKLDSKADKADVAVLGQKLNSQDKTLEDHGLRIKVLEAKQDDRVSSHRFRLPLVISTVSLCVSPFIWLLANHLVH